MLQKALVGNGFPDVEVRVHDAATGDRYLVCSDGLYAVVPDAAEPHAAAGAQLAAVRDAEAPDDVGVVMADVAEAPAR